MAGNMFDLFKELFGRSRVSSPTDFATKGYVDALFAPFASGTTKYLSLAPADFRVLHDGDEYFLSTSIGQGYFDSDNANSFVAPVHLPHGAVFKKAIVYGADSANTWKLIYGSVDDIGMTEKVGAQVNSYSTTITWVIDNLTTQYGIRATCGANDKIYGGIVVYELP